MGHSFCEKCGQAVSIRESRFVRGRLLCLKCADAVPASSSGVQGESPAQSAGQVVCLKCGNAIPDAGATQPLPIPLCGSCLAFFRNRPFPNWVRVSFAALLGIVVLALLWNARFMHAYLELRQIEKVLLAGDIDKAAALADSAARRVPENLELRCFADYHRAIVLLRDDKNREALAKLRACRGVLPPGFGVDVLMLLAEMGVAFNDADYEGFLKAAEELLKLQPNDPMSLASVASAYACKYATSGDQAFRKKSLESLEKAKALEPPPGSSEYAMRIHHRLETREIISRDEFVKRFPDGWPPKENQR